MDGENVEEEKQLPSEHENGNDGHGDGQNFTQGHAGAAGLKTAGQQPKNVERREAEYGAPKHVVEGDAASGRELKSEKHHRQSVPRSGFRHAQSGAQSAKKFLSAILHGFAGRRQRSIWLE